MLCYVIILCSYI